MTHKPINQKGIAAVEAVLILVIAAIIGGTGYYVYKSYDKSNDAQNTSHQNAQTATPPKKDAKKDEAAQKDAQKTDDKTTAPKQEAAPTN